MNKKKYNPPIVKMVVFRMELGFGGSISGSSNEGFGGELFGHEHFAGESSGNEKFGGELSGNEGFGGDDSSPIF